MTGAIFPLLARIYQEEAIGVFASFWTSSQVASLGVTLTLVNQRAVTVIATAIKAKNVFLTAFILIPL
jgi:hypothetical protein